MSELFERLMFVDGNPGIYLVLSSSIRFIYLFILLFVFSKSGVSVIYDI